MEIEVLVEQLRNIRESLSRIEDKRLAAIELHLTTLNGRMAKAEQWQAATDPVLDSMNERIDGATDNCAKNTEYIDQQKGWNSGRTQMIVQIGTLIGIGATLLKLIFSHSY